MSEPVTNAVVEDVLSSIRRLVSEDKRPVPAAKAPPQNERLVLTPSLRVTDEPKTTADEAALALAEQEVCSLSVDAPPKRETAVAEAVVPEAVRHDPTNIDSLVSDDTPLDVMSDGFTDFQGGAAQVVEADDIPDVDDPVLDAEEVDAEVLFDDASTDYSTDPYGFDDESDSDAGDDDSYLKKFLLRDRTTVSEGDDLPEIQTSPRQEQNEVTVPEVEDAEVVVPKTEREDALREDVPAAPHIPDVTNEDPIVSDAEVEPHSAEILDVESIEATSQAEPEVESAPSDLEGEAKPTSAPLSAKIAALETAIGQIAETWEPEEAGESDYAGSEAETMAWEDDVVDEDLRKPVAAILRAAFSDPDETVTSEASAKELAQDAPELADTHENLTPDAESKADSKDAPGDFEAEEQLIDEESLRDLVSEIVRAELQGALGERITRNVRKLVRREIHRALTAQELE